jgi:hypothetical protein
VKTKTRTRVLALAMTLAVMAPIEVILLQAWSTPDPKLAIREYVTGLNRDELRAAADVIGDYPFNYRREIVRALDREGRAAVWQKHLGRYLETHPGLDSTARIVLETAIALATPSFFEHPTAAEREQAQLLAEQVVTLLGREEAEFLLYRLGPKDGRFASREPLSMRFANWVRGVAIAMADEATDCNCNSEYGCDSSGTSCRTGAQGCTIDEDWPACGWFWNQTCDGLCSVGSVEG